MPHLRLGGNGYSSIFMFHMYGLDMGPIAGCDVAVVQRLCTEQNYAALQRMKSFGLKLIYDLDDNMWAIPPYNPAYKMFKQLEPGFRVCAAACDMITVSTEPLRIAVRRAIGKNCPPVEVVQNSMDHDWFAPVPEELRKKKGDRVVLGWAGTNTHTGDVKHIFSILPKLVDRLPQLELEFVGLPAPNEFRDVDGKIVHPRVRERDFCPVAEWPARWASWQWDIAIAPLDDNKFNASKSNIKALESAALSIPCVVSDVAPYHDFCAHSKLLKQTVLAYGQLDWERKIEALVVNSELRKSVGTEMHRVSREYYDISASVKRIEELAEAL